VIIALSALLFGRAAEAQTTYALGVSSIVEGPAAGSDSVVLALNPATGVWTATANDSWLHVTAGSAGGTGSANVIFSFDVNTGATRTGTFTIGDQTLAITQAASTYAAAGAVTTLASSGPSLRLSEPAGVAVDSAGNVYVAATEGDAVICWTAATGAASNLFLTTPSYPSGVAVDGSGNVYIVEPGGYALKEWQAATKTLVTLVSEGLNGPSGVAVDAAGNVYIADTGDNAIKVWKAATQTLTTLVSTGLSAPSGVAVDAAGNVYIADTGNYAVKEWTAATGKVATLISSGLRAPGSVAVDGSGNIYVADDNGIEKWTAATGQMTTLVLVGNGLAGQRGVAVDVSGNVYFSDTGNYALKGLPRAFVDLTPIPENIAAGSDTFYVVLPATENLQGGFAPVSSQSWLTVDFGGQWADFSLGGGRGRRGRRILR
jgi:sugar lactone lactonase YvrE